MKSIAGALQTHLDGNVRALSWLWKITRKDTTEYFFTNHDRDIPFGGDTYKAKTGFNPSEINQKGNLSVDSGEASGFFGDVSSEDITENALEAGLFDGAALEIFVVNHKAPADGSVKQLKATIGDISHSADGFSAEIRSLSQKLQNVTGEVTSPLCRADLGDTRCQVVLSTFTVSASVTAVVDNANFEDDTTANIINKLDGHFEAGLLTFTSGLNNGLAMEVKIFTQTDGVFELVQPVPFNVAVADTFDVYAGCKKRPFIDCRDKFNILVNFRGEPFVPGSDYLATYPDAK